MKKIVMIILAAGLLFGAAACQSKEDKTTPTPEATSSMPEATPADKPETTEPTMAPEAKQGEEKTITGKINDIKNVMFILDDGKDAYVFPIDENFKMEGIKDGDQVTVTYTGELSVTGDTEFTTVKVEKAN